MRSFPPTASKEGKEKNESSKHLTSLLQESTGASHWTERLALKPQIDALCVVCMATRKLHDIFIWNIFEADGAESPKRLLTDSGW
mmetsp:Transcript_34010/g.65839  ORF Transcript_34010/g.65839 Transcript_34010/m.65839 type:complete len:85 (+) Transcript_34010:97-351(+)|eukprot:CAMPEP_0172779648 /NCGR_PEP_ID=MMETSP1074-20121228/202528_1 /TAXON_ID=2916 /ORGANISM="Ceratium fusus, Strain PA161109" /LENGTH=84 /DNA_ID=CAMNT_0013616613 /DNA_START=675 /DNA_END=926 /DNA_ORIENTATION=+